MFCGTDTEALVGTDTEAPVGTDTALTPQVIGSFNGSIFGHSLPKSGAGYDGAFRAHAASINVPTFVRMLVIHVSNVEYGIV